MRPRPISEQNYRAIILFNSSLYNMRTKPQTIIFFFDIQLLCWYRGVDLDFSLTKILWAELLWVPAWLWFFPTGKDGNLRQLVGVE